MLLKGTILSHLVMLVILWSQLKLPARKQTFGLDKDLLTLALPAAGEQLMMRAERCSDHSLVTFLLGRSRREKLSGGFDPV